MTRTNKMLALLLALIMVAFANIGTMGNGLYVNDMVIKSAFPKVPYKALVIVMAVLISGLTIWGGVSENFGAFISIAAYLQGPINGIILVDCFILRKRNNAGNNRSGVASNTVLFLPSGFLTTCNRVLRHFIFFCHQTFMQALVC